MKYFDTKVEMDVRVYYEQKDNLPLEICYIDFLKDKKVFRWMGEIERDVIESNLETFTKEAKKHES